MNICSNIAPVDLSSRIIDHLTLLGDDDRYMRFGYLATNQQIMNYVKSSFKDDTSYWMLGELGGKVIATLHMSVQSDYAEFGLTVSKEYRGKGKGKSLFAQAYEKCRELKLKSIHLNCLRQNKAMQNIAVSFRLTIKHNGSDSTAVIFIKYE